MSLTVGKIAKSDQDYKWIIDKFSTRVDQLERGIYLCSPNFSTLCEDEESPKKMKNLQWYLQIQLMCNKNMAVRLANIDSEVVAKFSIAIIGASGKNIIKSVPECRVLFDNFQRLRGWDDFVNMKHILSNPKEFLVNDSLIVSCRIYETKSHVVTHPVEELEDKSYTKMLTYFEELLLTGDLSDVTLVIGESSIPSHRNILSSLSPRFCAIFKCKSEHKEYFVNIDDVELDIMHEMLRYIYTRKVKGIKKIATDLYLAAHRYGVSELKELCEKQFCTNVNAENAIKLLGFAMQYDIESLKPKLLKLIASELKEYMKKGEFYDLSSECKDALLSYISEKKIVDP